jgi:Macrocin-O-methyltransferase (TylF)
VTEKFNYRQQTRSSADQVAARQQLIELLQNTPLPPDQLAVNLGLYIRSGAFAKFLFLDELYREILHIPGDVVEFGTWWGQSLVTFLNLRAIYEPYCPRKVVGFDTFKGYPEPSDRDRPSETIKIGGYGVSSKYQEHLTQLLQYHEQENVLSHVKKFELVAGDVTETAPAYFKARPEAAVALAFFDMALYRPTKVALEAIKDRLLKGSVVAFDEFNDADYPGETDAVRDVLGLRSHPFRRSRYLPARTYMVIE